MQLLEGWRLQGSEESIRALLLDLEVLLTAEKQKSSGFSIDKKQSHA